MPKIGSSIYTSCRTKIETRRSPARGIFVEYIAQFRGLADGLSELHKNAIHRDIKPSNILISGETWKISDFGLCAYVDPDPDDELTRLGEVIGPQNWMSPEANTVFCGIDEEISAVSDLYQLAAVFWLVVNNRHPTGILAHDDWRGPDNLYLPIEKALQHNPERRQSSSEQFRNETVSSIES